MDFVGSIEVEKKKKVHHLIEYVPFWPLEGRIRVRCDLRAGGNCGDGLIGGGAGKDGTTDEGQDTRRR